MKQYPEFKRTALIPDRLNISGSFLRTELLISTAGCLLPSAGRTTAKQFVRGNKEGTSQRRLEIKINFTRKQQAHITTSVRPLSMVLKKTVKKIITTQLISQTSRAHAATPNLSGGKKQIYGRVCSPRK